MLSGARTSHKYPTSADAFANIFLRFSLLKICAWIALSRHLRGPSLSYSFMPVPFLSQKHAELKPKFFGIRGFRRTLRFPNKCQILLALYSTLFRALLVNRIGTSLRVFPDLNLFSETARYYPVKTAHSSEDVLQDPLHLCG